MTNRVERVEARFPADVKALAERAAAASGYSLADYLAYLVRADAPQRLKRQGQIALLNEQFDHFIHICEVSVAPSKAFDAAALELDREGF